MSQNLLNGYFCQKNVYKVLATCSNCPSGRLRDRPDDDVCVVVLARAEEEHVRKDR